MRRDTRTALSLIVKYPRIGSMTTHWARACWTITGQWLPRQCIYARPSTCWHLEKNYQNMKHKSSLCRRPTPRGSEKAGRVSRRIDCPIVVIKLYVSASHKNNMWHGSCVRYMGSYAIRLWNWNWKLTQDHFLIKLWIQSTHRCSAPVFGLECTHCVS